MSNTIPKHFMRFGYHPDKQFFVSPFRDCYDGIVLNGNLVAYTTKAVSSFVSELITDKPYIIDPYTHAFGHSPRSIMRRNTEGELVVKASIQKLANICGDPAEKHLGMRSLNPADFTEELKESFTKNVLDFQHNVITEGLSESGNEKYLSKSERIPILLIAPYFHLSSNLFNIWIDTNIEFISRAKDRAIVEEYETPIFAEILVSRDAFFDQVIRGELLSRYRECEADGFVLWIEGFSEQEESDRLLGQYRDFIKELSEDGREILILYGGYFSIALKKYGASAVCHGPGYGEQRDVTPVGGGIPIPKFYYPRLHKRLAISSVAFAFQLEGIDTPPRYFDEVCDCRTCREVIDDDFANFANRYGESKFSIDRNGRAHEYATTEAKKIAIAHYIYQKEQEFKYVEDSNISQIRDDLAESFELCTEMFGVNEAAHLSAWSSALE